MKLKPSVVAVLLAFSTTAAWAADSDSTQSTDGANPTQAVGNAPSSNIENGAGDQIHWPYVNGQAEAAGSGSAADKDQSAASQGTSGDDQTATSQDSGGGDQSAASQESSGGDQSAANDENASGADQSAMSQEQGDSDQSAANDDASGADQSASSEDSSDDQTATSEESTGTEQSAASDEDASGAGQTASSEEGADQTAMSDEAGGDDQSAAAEDEGNDQVAEDAAGGDLMAMAHPRSRAGSFKPATLEDFKAATQDKLVVILPSGWQGSVPDLISSLQGQSDTEILILSQDEPEDSDQ